MTGTVQKEKDLTVRQSGNRVVSPRHISENILKHLFTIKLQRPTQILDPHISLLGSAYFDTVILKNKDAMYCLLPILNQFEVKTMLKPVEKAGAPFSVYKWFNIINKKIVGVKAGNQRSQPRKGSS